MDTLGAYLAPGQQPPYTGEDLYNPKLAKVFAMFSKLSYCGPLPGIVGSVAYSCGQTGLPGVVTECEEAGLVVVPGMVRTVEARDLDVYASIFGVVARFRLLGDATATGTPKEACIATFRGSIDNFANSVRDKQTSLGDASFKDCPGCKVHAGYAFVWSKMKPVLLDELESLGCDKSMPLYFTGHGSGAAVATLAMFDMATTEEFAVGASYVFESPLQGNKAFVQGLYDKVVRGMKAPLFSVKYGRDAVTRWPRGSDWYAAGLEVYYAEDQEANEGYLPEFCGFSMEHQEAGLLREGPRPDCGIMKQHLATLTAGDTCPSPLAPEKNFCQFTNFAAACYGGIGFEYKEFTAAALPAVSLPTDALHAPAVGADVSRLFKPAMAQAFAALTKLTYCGQQPGVYASVVSSCNKYCKDAGFAIDPGTVRSAGISDNDTPGAISFFVAKFKRVNHEANIPEEGCLLAIRGDADEATPAHKAANDARSQRSELVATRGETCAGCRVHEGYLAVWEKVQGRAVEELRSIGCTVGQKSSLYLTGHAMGGSVAEIGMYYLKEMGFDVQTGYTFEAERASNEAFGKALNVLYESDVGLFRVTHGKGAAPRSPESALGYADIGHEVYVGDDAATYTVCEAGDDECGLMAVPRAELRSDQWEICSNPFAPLGNLCSYDKNVCMNGNKLPGDTSDKSDSTAHR